MIKFESSFSRRRPDIIREELVSALLEGKSFEFPALFEVVLVKLRDCKSLNGTEEILRLRSYDKLQRLVREGVVSKTGKSYKANRVQ